ncbi:sugar transferase [Pseudogemmobacter faecipullorum]|uniref:Sugar transferase n=1 Tax=Pseudogemmobacter faecipullorum TaxID=2755041 RepID=A0ABS8CRH5_9RHOB|nr:sugar transferase [Pseudogemmobacter faecipullorum]
MTVTKRLFDILVALVLGIILIFPVAFTALLILIRDGRPVFYISERMKTPTEGFRLVKFRTMKTVASDSGVSGGDKADRITKNGHFLRRTRLDEVPQLWNVLKGDISFVGPRPPLRQYVERFPELYREVLKSRPGITGLASVYFHAHEEWLLARARTTAETDVIYSRVCVPRKARIDLIYQNRRNLCVDAMIMLKTVFKRLR